MKELMTSHTVPADRGTVAYCFVLSETRENSEWVTHFKNLENGGKSWGHYFRDYEEAVKDFENRVFKDIQERRGF